MKKTVCVFCASSQRIADEYARVAREIGQRCAQRRYRVVNGAGALGLMGALNDACLDAGGEVTGVIPRFMVERGWLYHRLRDVVITETMGERKETMWRLSQGVLALAGGCGTMEELLETITQKQLGLYRYPIVIVNTNGFYDPLLAQLQRAIDEGLMKPQHAQLWQVAADADEALQMLDQLPEMVGEPLND